MKKGDEKKTKEQLLNELNQLRRRIGELESEEKFRSLIENIPDVTWTTSSEGITTFISSNIEKVSGCTPKEVYEGSKSSWLGRIHPDDTEKVEKTFELLFTENKMFDIEYRIQRKDGEWIWAHNRAITTYKKDGVMYADGIFSDITECKKAEEALIESEEKYRALVENSPNFINIFQDGRLKYVNNSMYKALGWTFEEITSPSFNFIEKIIPQRFQALLKENIAKRFRGESVPLYESALKTKDGSEIPIIVSAQLISYQGKPATEVILVDITERKKAEEALWERQHLNELLLDSLPHPAMLINKRRVVLAANKIAFDVGAKIGDYCWKEFGKSEYLSDIDKERARKNPHYKGIQCAFCLMDEAMDGKMNTKNDPEFHAFNKTWDAYWVPIDNEVFLHYAIDITERKKAEEALRESEERLRLLIESAEDVILMQDIEGKYLYYSGPPKYGIKPGEVIGKTPFDFHSPENAAKFMGKLEEVVKSGKSMTYETLMDWWGEKLWFIDQMSPIKDSTGNVKGVVTISRNITEHKKAEEELTEYKKRHYQSERLAATGRLAASIAHEINNPLQAISFNLVFVKNAVTDGFKEKRSIEQIEIGTERIRSTVKQLLDIHRGKIDVKEKVNVNDTIEATLNLLKNQLMINNVVVKKSLSRDIPLITGITQELFQVFMNLILNAQDAMEKGGILNISTRVKNNKLRIIFKDNGCGISKKDMDHIFEPFFTTKSDMLGTGLGLSTSKGIIDSLGGEIGVKSTIGKGSTFTITFPIIK